MITHARRVLLAVALLAPIACGSPPAASSAQPQTPPQPQPPTAQPPTGDAAHARSGQRLVVLLVVDQLPSWTFSRHVSAFTGGFARLVREGAYWPRGAYPYAATITAVGHTALATGAPPRTSGIIGNSWWDRAQHRFVDSTEDPAHPTVPPLPGRDDGASARARRVEAVGAGKRVLSVSYKERAAILMAPSQGAVATWYEPSEQRFVTSTAFAPSSPAWLDDLARTHPIAPRLDYVWTPLDTTPKRALANDAGAGEVGKFGLGVTFPHDLRKTNDATHAVGATPLASELVLEAALAGLDAVHPDLLDVSFSTHDLAAHAWGQESWEATDVLFRLDLVIGKLLDALDARYGKDGWSLVFSADHGGPRMPERGSGNARVDIADLERDLAKVAPIDAIDERMVWLKDPASADAVVARLRTEPGIGFAFRADALTTHADCKGFATELEALVCESIAPGRAGDVLYGPREGSFVMRKPFEADFHGTPYSYDREVPIVVREPGRAPRAIEGETPSTLHIAPTLARLLGVAPPPGAREPPLAW